MAKEAQGENRKEASTEISPVLCAVNLKAVRKKLKQSQTEFWSRFGVTQSRGSRYEKGLCLPSSVAILVKLYLENKVNDTDLLTALHGSMRQESSASSR